MGLFNENLGNINEAIIWYNLAAEQNNSNAQYLLGIYYKELADAIDTELKNELGKR